MKKLLTIYLVLFISVSTVWAQAPDRSSPPPLTKAKNLQLPPIQKFILSNGMNVVLMEKHSVPLVQVNLLIQTGAFDDPAGKEGLSSLAFDLMDEGAAGMDALQLADEIEYLGSNIGTYSGSFSSGINCSSPASKIDQALKLMSDIALKPTFSEKDLERVRKLRLTSLLQGYDEPTIIASRAFNKVMFGESLPYGKFANEQSLKSFTQSDLVNFHKSQIITGNTTVIAVGDISKQSLTQLLEKHFSGFPKGAPSNMTRPVPQQVKGRAIYLVDKPGAAQSVIRIGRLAAARTTPDYENIVVMNTILGGSFTSRLNNNLREVHGYAYGAGSGFSFWPMASPFTASSSVQTDVTGPALGEFFNEFKKIRTPIPDVEFERGKNYEALGYAGQFEVLGSIAGALAEMVIYQLPDNYFNTYVEKVLAVNKKGVETAAKKYIAPENMLVVIVGDRAKVEEGIKKLNLGTLNILSIEDVLGKKPQL